MVQVSGFIDLTDTFNDPNAPVAVPAKPQARSPITPITLEELIDQSNPLPLKLRSVVRAATEYVQRAINERDDQGETFTQRLTYARTLPDDAADKVAVVNIIDDRVMDWQKTYRGTLRDNELRWVRARVIDNLLGAGAIEPLRRDPRVTEVLVRAPYPLLTDTPDGSRYGQGTAVEVYGQGLLDAPGVVFGSDTEVLQFVEVLHPEGRQPTLTKPILSGSLPDGTRLEAVHPVVAGGHTFISLRRHPEEAHTLVDLVEWQSMSPELAMDLAAMVRARLNLVVSGGTSSGKTTLLGALMPFLPSDVHLILVEDTQELKEPKHLRLVSRRLTRPADGGSVEDVDIRRQVRSALRSRPDVIIVGEVRGAEAVDALTAMNTGHEGSMLTCHANSAHETVIRLETMMSESGEVSEAAATHKIASSIDVIVFTRRLPDGRRRVTMVAEVVKPPLTDTRRIDHVELRPLWVWDEASGTQVRVGDLSAELLDVRQIPHLPVISWDEVERIAGLRRVRADIAS